MKTVLILSIVVLSTIITSPLTILASDSSTYRDKFIDLYIRIAALSSKGVYVQDLVEKLREAKEALSSNNLDEVERILSELEVQVSVLEKEAPGIIFRQSLIKVFTIAILASIPIAIYITLPRVYLRLWYLTRRRWYIRYEHSR